MPRAHTSDADLEPGQHLVLYDGVCALCNWTVRFILARDRRRRFDFASLQSEVARRFLERLPASARADDTFYVVADYREENAAAPIGRSRAAVYVARRLDAPWLWLGTAVSLLPGPLLDWLYDRVAKYRYQVFGQYDTCPVPAPEHRSRFVG